MSVNRTRRLVVKSSTEKTGGGSRSFDDLFRQEFEKRFSSLFQYVDRLSGDPDLAADIAQEAFVRLYRRRAMPDETGSWLTVVARNLLHNARSKAARRSHLLARDRAQRTVANEESAEATLESARTRTAVREALGRLPLRDRELLILRYSGYSYSEMAQTLDINPASIGTLLARAKKTFRKALEGGSDATPR